MRPYDKDKLNQCLTILDDTDLGLPMVWLWTWSTIKDLMQDEQYRFKKNENELWDALCQAVTNGQGFSLEFGAEYHYEEVQDWLLRKDYMVDMMFEDVDADV